MGRQKKNELDAILEQLKKSYATDVDDELEDSLLETEESEEDAELASILERIFEPNSVAAENADNDTNEDSGAIININFEDEMDEESDTESCNETAEDAVRLSDAYDEDEPDCAIVTSEIIESKIINGDEASDATFQADNGVIYKEESDESTEEERVDSVLKMMFPQKNREKISEFTSDIEKIETVSENNASLSDVFPKDSINEENDFKSEINESDLFFNEIEDEDKDYKENIETIVNFSDENSESGEELFECTHSIENNVKDGFDDMLYESYHNIAESESIDTSDEDVIETVVDPVTTIEAPTEKNLIYDLEDYTMDILQHSLADMSLYKPQDDIDFMFCEQADNENAEQTVLVEESSQSTPKTELSDSDVSLLLKFGYSGEIATSVGNEHAQTVVVEKNNEYKPQKHRIVHGFTGNEFSSSDQTEGVIKKFKSDKMRLLIFGAILSLFAVAMIICDVSASFAGNVNDYLSLIFSETVIVIITIAILAKRLYIGVLGIARFEANSYSMLSVILAEYLFYCLTMGIVYSISPILVYSELYIAFGGYVSLYAALTVWAEYLDCCRESNAFNIMCDGKIHCILEKNLSGSTLPNEKIGKHNDVGHSIKRSQFVSGFFRRMFEHSVSTVNIVLIIGVIPFVAIVMGIMIALLRDNIVIGINAAGFIFFSVVPLSTIFVPSVIEFINSLKLRRTHSAFIGIDSVNEYSIIDTITFSDCDAVEITALLEINPNKNGENSKKWLNIAGNVFEALGGPLSKMVRVNKPEESNVSCDSTINSISENGIDLYFDSSMNILIGDRHYMLAHNIKVKTDTNLSTAVKGIDRTVIYMAFDGIPRIGFIVTSKIKRNFLETIELLKEYNIKMIVSSYEPEINDYYFESNKVENVLSVHKPTNYDRSDPSVISDSGIISSDPYELCRTVIHSHKMIKDRANSKRIHGIQTAIGAIIAGILIAISCLDPISETVVFVQSLTLPLFYLNVVLCLIPNIIQIVKLLKRK